jgi:hypothetical protein
MRTIYAALIGLTLCTPVIAAPALAAVATNPFNDRVMHLSLADRNGALRRAVTLEDQKCGRLAKSVSLGLYGNLGLWQVRCVPGGDYGVFLGPDGSVQVRSCADMASLKLPKCGKMD